MQSRITVPALAISLALLAFQAHAAELGAIARHAIPPKPGVKPGSTHEITAGPDGHLWMTQQNQSRIVRVTTKGEFKTFDLKPGAGPHGIEFDKAGHLWITQEFANSIARLDADGKLIREYPIPQEKAGPHGLAIGHDGRTVWWTGKTGDVIGKLDPDSGAMRLFPLPNKGSLPIYIERGPAGAMLFTELTGNRIGRISEGGHLSEYKIPSPNTRPIVVLQSPDGTIWFSQEAGHGFAKIDGAGKITEYKLPGPLAESAGIALDRNKTLWIQYSKPDAIGRIRPDMSVQEFKLPGKGNAVMHRIILGPDGNMWFTELATDYVGYIVTGAKP